MQCIRHVIDDRSARAVTVLGWSLSRDLVV
jgi:hypothetical protein